MSPEPFSNSHGGRDEPKEVLLAMPTSMGSKAPQADEPDVDARLLGHVWWMFPAMTPEEAVVELQRCLQSECWCSDCSPGLEVARARVLSMMRQDPADTAASALADAQAIREQRREAGKQAGDNVEMFPSWATIRALQSVVAALERRLATLEQANRDAWEANKLLRERVAKLEASDQVQDDSIARLEGK